MITTTVRRFAVLTGMLAVLGAAGIPAASAAQAPVGLGTAAPFAVLAGTTVTNTGPSVINGDLGVSPGSAVTGFPPGTVHGTQHVADAVALQAQKDLVTAYNDAAGRTPVHIVSADLGGQTLAPGVYKATSAMSLTGTLTLDAHGVPGAVWIFQAGSTLITGSSSRVSLTNGASPCNVFWQVGSSATIATGNQFAGTVMALTSIAVQTGATVQGRVLARNGAVTLDNNVITASACTSPSPSPTPTTTSSSPAPTPTATSSSPAPTPTATSTSPGPFPSGPPETGAGGSLHSGNPVLVAAALAALAGVAILATETIRRRRISSE
jgi:hypothetical protein